LTTILKNQFAHVKQFDHRCLKKRYDKMAFFVTKNNIRQNSVDCDVIGCDVTTIKFVTFVTGNVENINRYKKWRPL